MSGAKQYGCSPIGRSPQDPLACSTGMIRLRAPAKLNLYLRLLGKRPDGYHEIETLFERIDLADELTVEPQPDGVTLTCSEPSLSCGEDNLVLKAARLLQQATGVPRGARLHLIKRIPIAAGLGGGSSDAAAALRGLNEAWQLGLDSARLLELAAQLGADVPFFLSEAPFAIGRGRGDVCEPLSQAPRLAHVVVVPDAQLSTAEVYAGTRFDLTSATPSLTMVVHALRNGPDWSGLAEGLRNDLEPAAIRRCPVIPHIQSRLRDLRCVGVGLSGSGPSVFGLCRDRAHAQEVAMTLRQSARAAWRIEVVETDPPSNGVRDGDHGGPGRVV